MAQILAAGSPNDPEYRRRVRTVRLEKPPDEEVSVEAATMACLTGGIHF